MHQQLQTYRNPRSREISFSDSFELQQRASTRDDSPSIALQSAVELTSQPTPSNSNHYQYLRSAADTSLKINKNSKPNKQNITRAQFCKQRLILNHCQKTKGDQPRTPLRQKNLNHKDALANSEFSQSPMRIQKQRSAVRLKDQHCSQLQGLNDQNQLEPLDYLLLSQRLMGEVDNEISRLHIKIGQLQKMKKSMKVVGAKAEASKAINNSSAKTSSADLTGNTISINSVGSSSINQTELMGGSMIRSQFVDLKEKINRQDIQMPKLLRALPSKRKKNMVEADIPKCSQFDQIQAILQDTSNKRAKKLIQYTPKSPARIILKNRNGELARLLRNIQNQIRLDDGLRKAKKWFQRLRCDSKWQQLQDFLKGKYQMRREVIEQVFSISSQEQNPFYTPRTTDFVIQDLLQHYTLATKHWLQNIVGNFTEEGLAREQFVEEKIDICKRGIVNIQDLVRYINFELDLAFRNRDIFLIFHRFKKQSPLYFTDIIDCLTNQQ